MQTVAAQCGFFYGLKMAIETFTWPVQIQAQQQISYPQRVRSTQFGEGYEQVSGDGINPETIQVPITWTGSKSEAMALRNFLRRHVVKSFFFTPPFELQGLYRVTPDSINLVPVAANVATVTATFKQAHSV